MSNSKEISSFYGFAVASVSFVVFLLLHVGVLLVGVPGYITEKDQWKWKNLFISWVHSVAIGAACIYSFIAYPDLMSDLMEFINWFTYTAVAASTGYFVCDAFDIIASRQVSAMWEVLLHHAGVLSIFLYNIFECRYIGYTIVALVVEVNSIFLHLRKLMQMASVGFQHPVYRIVTVANLTSFVGCRFVFSLSLITYGLIVYHDRMSTFYLCLLASTMFIMWVVNSVLFWRLVKNDLLRGRRVSAAAAARLSSHGVVNNNSIIKPNNNNTKRKSVEDSPMNDVSVVKPLLHSQQHKRTA